MVARATNKRIVAQIVWSTIKCDKVLCAADSFELRRWGFTSGLASYAAAYATGLLLARRLLKQIGLDTLYAGQTKVDGAYFNVEDDVKDKKPFKAILDVGLVRTSTGNRVFGVLKGACDGGINVPHSETRFPGYVRSGEEGEANKYVPENHKSRIFGKHIDSYMKKLKEQSSEAYHKQFSMWDKTLKAAHVDSVEKLMTKVHAEIRKNPDRAAPKKHDTSKRDHKKFYPTRLTVAQRQENVRRKFQIAAAK